MKNCHECSEEMDDDNESASCDRCIEETEVGNEALQEHARMVAEWEHNNPDKVRDI